MSTSSYTMLRLYVVSKKKIVKMEDPEMLKINVKLLESGASG